jgi:ABC-2 type transport system ATP-binding protein
MSQLSVDRIRKSYGSHLAVDEVSFTVAPGEIVGFVGPNGAGKSTTLRILTGLLHPDAGTVTLDGLDSERQSRAFRAQVGALIESPAMFPMLTAIAHLQYVARLRGDPNTSGLRDTLRAVGLGPDMRKPVRQFSLGMKQRLGIAMAIFGRPSLLVLDEPMNGLDPTGIAELRDFIRTLPARVGSSVLVSSHLLGEIEHTCDRVLFIRDGRIVGNTRLAGGTGTPEVVFVRTGDDLLAAALLRQATFVREVVPDPAGGIRCRMLGEDVPNIAPLLVQHGIALFELVSGRQSLEDIYRSHFPGARS